MFVAQANVMCLALKNVPKHYEHSLLSKILLRSCNKPIFQHFSSLHTSQNVNISYKKHGVTVTETDTSRKDKSPVVAILGWMGSNDKHLRKYSDIFTQKNYGTVRVTVNTFDTFFRCDTKLKQIGYKVLKILEEVNCQERPVFLYTLSNGGGLIFFHIMEALTTPESKYFGKIKVVGSIFDSCPAVNPADKKNVKCARIARVHMTKRFHNPIARTLVWYGLGMFLPPIVYLISMDPTYKRYTNGLKTSSLLCNQLVLYSKTDRVAPYLDIDDYIEARRSLGVDVVAKRWEKSAHIRHYREHTDEYLQLVHDFVEECLEHVQ